MSVIGIGVDVIECSRIQHSIERFGDRFLHRVFTDGEIEYSMSMKFPERHLAARFAGKEAVAKAFGTGIGKAMGWRNIDIRKKESGEPFLVFSGPAEAFAAETGRRFGSHHSQPHRKLRCRVRCSSRVILRSNAALVVTALRAVVSSVIGFNPNRDRPQAGGYIIA